MASTMTGSVMKRAVRSRMLVAVGLVASFSVIPSAFPATDHAVSPVVQGRPAGSLSSWSQPAPGGGLSRDAVVIGVAAPDESDTDLDRYVELHERTLGTSVRSLLMPWSSLKPMAN